MLFKSAENFGVKKFGERNAEAVTEHFYSDDAGIYAFAVDYILDG